MNKKRVISHLNPLFLNGIAHRGLHNEEFTENGLKAFQNAKDHNLAIELDVHVTKDHQLIVCHDDELLRTTGKKGIIEELTSKEIRDNYRLLDGGVVPTFKEVLSLTNEEIPIVVELKVHEKNFVPLAKQLKKELRSIKNKKNYFLISFDPRALVPFKFSGFMRSLLICKQHESSYKYLRFFESLDVEDVLLQEPKYQKYSKKHFVNVWTITNSEKLEKVLPYVDTVTFQEMDFQEVTNRLKTKNN